MRKHHDSGAPVTAVRPAPNGGSARRLPGPPLRALATFEAAARLGSFHAAARELHLTPSAISHQIIGLEQLLGIALFARAGRGVVLTARGARYFEQVQCGLSALDAATRDLTRAAAAEVVAIHTPPSIASKWLLPLLPGFLETYPDIEVHVNAEPSRAGFSWRTTDLAILYAAARADESNAAPLLEESILPMCSPDVLRKRPIHTHTDVLDHVLICTEANAVSWKDWFHARELSGARRPGRSGLPAQSGRSERIHIDPSHVAIEAAATGLGVVLESDVLARNELASGRLVAPLPHPVRRRSYRLAWGPGRALGPGAMLLRDWLLANDVRPISATPKRPRRTGANDSRRS